MDKYEFLCEFQAGGRFNSEVRLRRIEALNRRAQWPLTTPWPEQRREAATKSDLKNWILFQDQGGTKFEPADILRYFEELKRGANAEIGTKDFFTIAFKG